LLHIHVLTQFLCLWKAAIKRSIKQKSLQDIIEAIQKPVLKKFITLFNYRVTSIIVVEA